MIRNAAGKITNYCSIACSSYFSSCRSFRKRPPSYFLSFVGSLLSFSFSIQNVPFIFDNQSVQTAQTARACVCKCNYGFNTQNEKSSQWKMRILAYFHENITNRNLFIEVKKCTSGKSEESYFKIYQICRPNSKKNFR